MKKRNLIIISLVLLLSAAGLVYYLLSNRVTRRDMAELVPSTAYAYIEVNGISDLLAGIIKTQAWQKLAPQLGISNQIKYLATTADALALTGVGPDEAVLLARAQYAVVIDGLSAETKPAVAEQADQLELVPRLAIIIETHASAKRVDQNLMSKMELLARRIYGSDITTRSQNYQGIPIKLFFAKDGDRQILATQSESILIVGNHIETIKSCLDVILKRRARLSDDAFLQQARGQFGSKSPIFAFIPGAAASRFLQVGSQLSGNGQGLSKLKDQGEEFFQSLSSQLINGFAYTADFENGKVSERYLTLLPPEITERLTGLQPANQTQLLELARKISTDFWLIRVTKPAQALEQVVAAVSSHTNVVVSFALRNLIIDLSRQYGLDANDPIGELIGNEVCLIKPIKPTAEKAQKQTGETANEKGNSVLLLVVRNKAKLLPTIGRYLRKDGNQVRSEQYQGFEIVSAQNNGRAAAFIGDLLALGERGQIVALIDQVRADRPLPQFNSIDEQQALMTTHYSDRESVGEFMLGISRLLRASDGSHDMLQRPAIQTVLGELPPSISRTRVIPDGIIIEYSSSLGSFTLASVLFAEPAGELRETTADQIK